MALSYVLGGGVNCFPSLKTYPHEGYGDGSGIALFGPDLDFSFDARLRKRSCQSKDGTKVIDELKGKTETDRR